MRYIAALLFALFSSNAYAQLPGPSNPPNPWVVSNGSLNYAGCVTVGPSLSCMGTGTLNVLGIYVNGVPVTLPVVGGGSGQIQYNNLGQLAGFTMAGDCTFSVPNITCTKTNSVAFGTAATKNTGSSGTNVIPTYDASGTYTGTNTFSGTSNTFGGSDATFKFFVRGATRGLRFGFDSNYSYISAMDQTATTYQNFAFNAASSIWGSSGSTIYTMSSTGLSFATGMYLNFGNTSGASGYGIYDNAGTLQVKNSGGAWTNLLNNCATMPSGGKCLLNTLTASSSANLQDTTSFVAGYSQYEIEIENLLPSAANTACQLTIQSGGSFKSTGYYGGMLYWTPGGVSSVGNTTTYIPCDPSGIINNASPGFNMHITVGGLSNNAKHVFIMQGVSTTASQPVLVGSGGGSWDTAGAITGLQFTPSTGTWTSGTIRIYGIKS